MYWNSNSSFVDKWGKRGDEGADPFWELHLVWVAKSTSSTCCSSPTPKEKKRITSVADPLVFRRFRAAPFVPISPPQGLPRWCSGFDLLDLSGAVGSDGSVRATSVFYLQPTARQWKKRRVETNSKNQRRPTSPPCITGELTMACTVMLKLPLMYPVSSFMSFSRGISLVIS